MLVSECDEVEVNDENEAGIFGGYWNGIAGKGCGG
jgi:hypothetical protein